MPSNGRSRSPRGSRPASRPTWPHPDADRLTKRMPYHQLRALVLSSIPSIEALEAIESLDEIEAIEEIEELEPNEIIEEDPTNEFDSQPTVCVRVSRVSTLDELIASLPKHY